MGFEYPKNVRFRCEKCTLCCGDTKYKARSILLLKHEADRISRKTLLRLDEFTQRIEGSELYTHQMEKTENGKCVFLEIGLCSIYQIRPLVCFFYPFQLKALRDGRYTFSFTDECPGIGKGPELRRAFFEMLFRQFIESMRERHKLI